MGNKYIQTQLWFNTYYLHLDQQNSDGCAHFSFDKIPGTLSEEFQTMQEIFSNNLTPWVI